MSERESPTAGDGGPPSGSDGASSGSDGSATPATVQLLMADDRDRRLLAERLGDEYAVVETPPDDLHDASFDLCVVDSRSFERHRDELTAKKAAAEPAFLPYVFLADRQQLAAVPAAVWDTVDEVLAMPLVPAELTHRLENLLERRRLSLDLDRRRERSEERFRALFETAPDPVVVTSADGVIADANEAFARTVGEASEGLVGRSITDLEFASPTKIERVLLRVAGSDPTAGPSSVELDPEGDESMIMELNADVVTSVGEASERIGVFRDVTEREHREADLRRQNERLEEFASTIAHDLRNPLNVAKGHLELARNSADADSLDAVAGAHDRMEQLIDEILTLARQGQMVRDPEPVSLRAVAARAWGNVETDSASLSVEHGDRILADEGRLCECLENLFRNSVEHGSTSNRPSADAVEHREGGEDDVVVRVGRIDADDAGGFYVEDDGPGIPETDREGAFEVGYTTSADGTGFGLSIVRQISDGHGWTVSVTDGTDGGARFEFEGVSAPETSAPNASNDARP